MVARTRITALSAAAAAFVIALCTVSARGEAQARSEFRAVWIDTFNTALN